jgi:hypothetical protein
MELYQWNDQFLMEEFSRQGWKGHELNKLNECRMFLEITNLLELTTVDGKHIKEISWKGIKDKNRCNQFQWPRSPSTLPAQYWQLWRRALTDCFLRQMKVEDRELRMPLGDWDKDAPSTWRWFYSSEEEMLFKREGLLWSSYELNRHGQRRTRRNQDRQFDLVSTSVRDVMTDLL